MKLSLTYAVEHGRMTIECGAEGFELFHLRSMQPCALDDLGEAVLKLHYGADRATCAWADPPGEYRWLLERRGDGVQVSLLWFPDTFSRQDDAKGERLYSTACPLRRLTLQVKNALLSAATGGPCQSYFLATHAKLAAALHACRCG